MRSAVRVLGLDSERIEDFRTESSRNAGLYRALDERVRLVGTCSVRAPLWHERLTQLLYLTPGRDRWRQRAGLAPMALRARTRVAERELQRRAGSFDVVLEIYCIFPPGRLESDLRFAMFLDSTLAANRRHFPEGVPMSRRAERVWLEMERRAYGRARRLFPQSGWVRDSLVEDYGVDPRKIAIVGAGSNSVAGALGERRWDRRIALFVAMEWERKGGPALLSAWRQVRRELPDAQLWLVGPRRAPAPDGADGVRWFGRLGPERLAELYTEASAFVLPSQFDPFPHVLREAMGRGLPVISTPTGGTAEIFRDGRDGLLVPVDDHDAIARALIELLGDPARAEAMGRSAHAHVREEATWERVAERMVPHLEAIATE